MVGTCDTYAIQYPHKNKTWLNNVKRIIETFKNFCSVMAKLNTNKPAVNDENI